VQDSAKRFVSELHTFDLKTRGFTKNGHTFARKRDRYTERVQVQGSSWNSSSDPKWRFYLNAGVYFEGLPEPKANRALPGTHVYGRLSSFSPGCVDGFDLTNENADLVRAEVVSNIERALTAIAARLSRIREAAEAGRMLWHDSAGVGHE